MKFRPVGAELLHADGRTVMTKFIVAFRHFSNTPNKGKVFPVHDMKAQHGGEWSTSRPGRFTRRKELRYPLNRSLGVPQSRSGRFGEENKSLALCRE
jgi:hypothetical protein